MLATSVISVIKTTMPCTIGKSRTLVASTNNLPTPGQLKTVSVIGAPANKPPKYNPTYVAMGGLRSEEHTSELQSRSDLVCRLLLEKKKNQRRAHLLHPFAPLACMHYLRPHA